MDYSISTILDQPFDRALEATKEALTLQGFGILTEIDIAGLLKTRIGADIPAQVILGACRPPLAHAALRVEPSIGLLLPCNVVVRVLADGETLVEAVDPRVMLTLTGNEQLSDVAVEAGERLTAALVALDGTLVGQGDLSGGTTDRSVAQGIRC